MKKKTTSIKPCQDALLKLMIFFDNVCREIEVEYWIDGGTLLGAVRDQSFIPWDDDVDICLLVDDFDKLTKKLQEECEQHEFYLCYNSVRPPTYWTDNFGDVSLLSDGVLPVKLDLMPVKAIDNNPKAIAIDRSIVNIATYFKRGRFKNPQDVLDIHQSFLPKNRHELLRKKDEFYHFFINEYLPAHSQKGADKVYNYSYNDIMVSKVRPYYHHDDIFPLAKVTMEGHSFSCPNNLQNYLTILYGENYMTPPPKDKQVPYSLNHQINTLPKKRIETRLKLHFEREYKNVLARSSKNKIGRFYHKFTSFCSFVMSSISKGEFSFIFTYLKYTLKQFLP